MNLPDRIDRPGEENGSSAQVFGELLRDEMNAHKDFYFFSPDETTSNRLATVFEASERAWARDVEPWDQHLAKGGRVIEMLSENTLFAVLAGHILSGGRGCMTSYEAFLPIVSSQLDQHLKFLKQSKTIEWREDVNALNILSTSCWQRQDHNGYTHQNPALISSVLAKSAKFANCLFPVDDVAAAAAWEYMKDAKNRVNIATFNKNPQPRWIDINHARYQLDEGRGCSIFGFASDEDPDIVVAAVGDIPTAEMLEAIKIVKKSLPGLRIRFAGIAALSSGAIGLVGNTLSKDQFNEIFTPDKKILVNFHGYPETMRAIMSHYADMDRVTVFGYDDEGSTTSPLDELARNHCSRYTLASYIFLRAGYPKHASECIKTNYDNARHALRTGLDQ